MKKKHKKEEIVIPIYFQINDKDEVIIDVEGIEDEFRDKLSRIVENPFEFLEI